MKKSIFLFWVFSTILVSESKGQWGNIWVHPNNNFRLDFNSGSPLITMPIMTNSLEGYSSICDDNGQLLFSTNGVNVFDKNMNLMPNGDSIGGGISSSQGVVIFPKPGSSHEYFVFTVDQMPVSTNSTNGLCWSLVDMDLNSGLGDVVTKENLLLDSCYEKITATRHCNGVDWWVIVHPWNTAKFVSFLVSSNGVEPNPQISEIGSTLNDSIWNFNICQGQMKISGKGNRIAIVNNRKNIEIFNFNNELGVVMDTILIENNPTTLSVLKYACSFSTNGNLFYSQNNSDIKEIFQYNVDYSDPQLVINSKTPIFNAPFGSSIVPFSVSCNHGPDGKIYFVTEDTIGGSGLCALSVVNKPNLPGLACEMVPQQHLITGANFLALPNFPDCIFARQHTATLHIPTCANTDSSIVVFDTLLNVVHDITWDFGDPASGVNNTYEGTDPFHLFSSPGTYTITLTFTNRCNQFVISRDVFIPNTTPPAIPVIVLNAAFLEASVSPNYQWYFNDSVIVGANDFAFAPNQNGIYTVSTTQNGCTVFSLPFQLTAVSLEQIKLLDSYSYIQSGDLISLQCNPISDCFQNIELIDLQGRVLKSYNYPQKISKVEIGLNELQSGVYLLRVNGREVRKVYKK